MAQIRNLLRGIAYTLRQTPAAVLTSLDDAMEGLAVQAFATVLLAQVEPADATGQRVLRWSNAGHPPPAVLAADGTARLLHTEPEALLGTGLQPRRTDHAMPLDVGATVVLYTDGLIERRDAILDVGMDALLAVLAGQQDSPVEQLSDRVLARFSADDDDVVLSVVRVRPGPDPQSSSA